MDEFPFKRLDFTFQLPFPCFLERVDFIFQGKEKKKIVDERNVFFFFFYVLEYVRTRLSLAFIDKIDTMHFIWCA